MLKLYHYWSSVCAQKVRIVLAEKKLTQGADWESHHLDLFEFDQLQPWYMKLNNKGVVPTLDHDGHIVTESNIICEYLDEVFPEIKLSPSNAQDRTRMRKWMLISEEDLHDAIAVASFNKRHRARMLAKYSIAEVQHKLEKLGNSDLAATTTERLKNGMPEDQEDAAYKKIEQVLDWMEEGLTAGPWLVGDHHTLADIAMMSYINRIEVLDRPQLIGADARPQIANWWARVQELKSFQEMMAFKNPDTSDPLPR